MQLRSNRTQRFLLPPSIDDFVDEDHPVRVVVEVVERLDLERFEVGPSSTGRPAYPAESLVAMMFYALSVGAFSAREMARRCKTDCAFMFATGGLKPSHQTISRFRASYEEALAELFGDVAVVLRRLGVASPDLVAVDGTRQKANASLFKHSKDEQLERELRRQRERMARLLNEAALRDAAEEDDDDDELPPALRDAKQRVASIERTLEQMKAGGKREQNSTDPDARLQKCREGPRPGYNAQAASTADGYVVAADVTNEAADTHQLLPMLEQVEDNLQEPVGVLLADAGYESGENLAALAERKQDAIVASAQTKNAHLRRTKIGRFQWIDFVHDPSTDEYICPGGRRLRVVSTRKDARTGAQRYIYRSRDCSGCSLAEQCLTPGTSARQLDLVRTAPAMLSMRERRRRDRSQDKLFAHRRTIAERPFGHLKHNIGWRHFMRRGLRACRAEFRMLCAAMNIAKLARHLRAASLKLSEALPAAEGA